MQRNKIYVDSDPLSTDQGSCTNHHTNIKTDCLIRNNEALKYGRTIYTDSEAFATVHNTNLHAKDGVMRNSATNNSIKILSQPQDIHANIGEIIKLTTNMAGTNLNFQWFDKYGAPIYGAKASEITLGPINEQHYGFYKLRINNQFGQEEFSRWCEIVKPVIRNTNSQNFSNNQLNFNPGSNQPQMNEPPTIIEHVKGGGYYREYADIHLEVQIRNAKQYQWYKDGQQIPGCTGDTLTIHQARKHNEGSYTVIGANEAGYVTAQSTFVTIQTFY